MNKVDISRLRWACRRGMLELDILLNGFLEECVEHLPVVEQEVFKRLLETNDQELYLWLTGKERSDNPELADMVDKIRLHAQQRNRN